MDICSSDVPCNSSSGIVNRFLFKPPAPCVYCFPNDLFRLQTSRGNRIYTTYIERPGATIHLLVSHGNAEDLNMCYGFMRKMSILLNVNVVGYDYSGYGCSTGLPSEQNCYDDISAVFEFLTEVLNIPPEHIVLYGRSVGSGPSCYLAQMSRRNGRPVAGLILHAAFASVFRLIMPDVFGMTVPGDPFPNIDRLREIDCPVFIAHGEHDNIVPYRHALSLLNVLPRQDKVQFFGSEGMHHNDFESVEVELSLITALNHFLDYHILARRLWAKEASEESSRRNAMACIRYVRG